LTRQDDVYWTLRQTLVARSEDLEAFDRAFRAWFLRAPTAPLRREPGGETVRLVRRSPGDGERPDARSGEGERESLGYSPEELLREKDFATHSTEEFGLVSKLMTELAASRPRRRSRRLRRDSQGRQLDMRRLVLASLATGGDAVERSVRDRIRVPRKLVVICDVSGSMEAYSRALVLFL